MKHLARHEISRLVGIQYKGSRNQNDLDFQRKAMDHILLCPMCLKQFKEKSQLLVDGLNFELKKKELTQKICAVVIENGCLSLRNLSNQFHCLTQRIYGLDLGISYSMSRNNFNKIPDFLLDYKNNDLYVMTFEEVDVFIQQDNHNIKYSYKTKDEITYEYCYIFEDIDVNQEFYLMIEEKK